MLSKDVKETLDEAQGLLRNALWKMARSERPGTLHHLTQIITDVEKLMEFDSILDTVEEILDKNNDE
jgi:hypothetical protein